MAYQVRTDLAAEARDLYMESGASLDGVESETEQEADGITVTRVRITDTEAEQALGKPKGS